MKSERLNERYTAFIPGNRKIKSGSLSERCGTNYEVINTLNNNNKTFLYISDHMALN